MSNLGAAYWRLWTSSGLSNLADGLVKVGLPLVAVQFTRSPTLIAGLAFAATVPWLLFALPAGALADRLDRRGAMLGANLLRGSLLGALALVVLLDLGSIWALYLVAFGLGVAETIHDTAAQSIMPQLVPGDQLSRANGRLYAVELTANEFAGPTLAGFLVATGAAVALAAPSALWVLAVAALLLVRGRFRVEREGNTTLRAEIAEGLRFLWRNRLLRTFAAMTGAVNFATSATTALLVLYAVGPASPMGLSEQAYGVLLATMAAGSLLGSLVTAWLERVLGRARCLMLSTVSAALLVGIPAVTVNPYLIGAAFFLGGAGIIGWNVVVVSLRQRITPPHLLGRMNSGFRLVAWGTRPLGAVAGGLLAELLGLRAVFALMALVVLGALAGMRIVTDTAMHDAERAPEGALLPDGGRR
ncbi:MFS transporter [Amycolatopsis cihanbeyliensis]|uniref:Fucose permease n=1 Tax=Amycolatopsis cihanbeyliensis TaxID=1128664 RepID=A0A542CS85_AMYCI|nr:MFS transporter [Amycolatopsis cihanbeyliensis]TQI93684.1 fucose permease [Amycolatopsis cihanbeyliensis]